MLEPEFTLRDTFAPVEPADWRKLAEAALNGAPFEKKLVTRTYEGIDLQPVYTRHDLPPVEDPAGLPGAPPFVRGADPLGTATCGLDLRQESRCRAPAEVNQEIREDLAGGVTSVLLPLDRAAQQGLDPDDPQAQAAAGVHGAMVYHVDDLARVLEEVDLARVGVFLEPGAAFLPAAALLAALWQRPAIDSTQVRGGLGADPLGTLARDGELPLPVEQALAHLADLAGWTAEHHPQVTSTCVDTSVYHHAGAHAAQDLALGMATAIEYLRAMTRNGLDIDTAARQIEFRIRIGTHHFLSIAKLRAARRLWSRVIEASGGTASAAAMRLHTRLSDRVLTRRDPYVNLLRNTVSVFAAVIGGAQAVTSVPLDQALDSSDAASRRIARNTTHVLQAEAQLHRVIDPAGGSWFLEKLTSQVAEEAWKLLQQIEAQGGIRSVLANGWAAGQIEAAYAGRAKDIATRREGITGVSEFPNLQEPPLVRPDVSAEELRESAAVRIRELRQERSSHLSFSTSASLTESAVAAARTGATLGQIARAVRLHQEPARVAPLVPRPLAEPYETLRDASDAWKATHGRRPGVFLANMGPLSHHTARKAYARSFFEAGGFEVFSNPGFDTPEAAVAGFREQGVSIAVICSSDALYPQFVPPLATQLKAAGARTVIVAGRPGDQEAAWRAAGVDRFIFIACDVLGTLRELLTEEGVLTQ